MFNFRCLILCHFILWSPAKRGPIYSVQWSPNSKEFCVVYGCILCHLTLLLNDNKLLFDFLLNFHWIFLWCYFSCVFIVLCLFHVSELQATMLMLAFLNVLFVQGLVVVWTRVKQSNLVCVWIGFYAIPLLNSWIINFIDSFLNLLFNFTTTPVMPAKATLFDLKCEPLFDFGTGPRNNVFYNPHGNNILTDYINIIYLSY